MAEPSAGRAGMLGSGPRRLGRLGLVLVVVAVLAALALTAPVRHPPPEPGGAPPPAPGSGSAPEPPLFLASVTAQGALVLRPGSTGHLWAVDAHGALRWQRDLVAGDRAVCGPCPAAVVRHGDGTAEAVGLSGEPAALPALVDGPVADTTSLVGAVLAPVGADGRTRFLVATSAGLVEAGSSIDARLDEPLNAVTPAIDGSGVFLLRAEADPLLQGQFQVMRLSGTRESVASVALDHRGGRPQPCAVDEGRSLAYLQPGLESDGPAATTRVVVETEGAPRLDVQVPGVFDACAAGRQGIVLAHSVVGAGSEADGGQVDLRWLSAEGAPRAEQHVPVSGRVAPVALDPRTSTAAVARPSEATVVLGPERRTERPSCVAVAFDDLGGLWSVDAGLHVTREPAP